jgi:transposase
VEHWTLRKIARHLHIGRRTIAKYLANPAPVAVHRSRSSKLDPFKPMIQDWLQQDPTVTGAVIEQRLRQQGFSGGHTIIRDYLYAIRQETKQRRAYVRMEPVAGERFEIDWGHFGSLVYDGAPRKLYAFCLIECHSRKLHVEFTHPQPDV